MEAGIPFRWTIAGGGSELENLKAMLKSNRPDQEVILKGNVSAEELETLLTSHDVFLLTSDGEVIPRAMLEAMGHGLVPVVTRLLGGITEVVDDTTGRLVNLDDVAGYSREIIFLHEHRAALRELSMAAQRRIQSEFSIASEAGRWVALLKNRPPVTANWPQHWSIQPPLGMEKSFFFSVTARAFKRTMKRFRSRFQS